MPSQYKGSKVGFPIRRSLDQSLFAAPQGLSQRTTSFIASQRQGIHQMLLRHLIALMIHVRRFRDSMCFSPCTLGRGAQAIRKTCSRLSPGTYLLAKQIRLERPAGPPAGGQLETLPHRIHSLFTISNTRRPPHKEQGMRVSCTRGVLANRTADLFDCPDTPKPPGPMVEPDGIEPTTSCLQSTRSPN